MTVRYHTRQDRLVPEYVCQRDGIEHAISICQRVVGDHIDHAVGQLLVESVAPLALEVTLSVQQELQARIEEVDKLRKKQVERARYEADLAQRRYLHVDPANRLVAGELAAVSSVATLVTFVMVFALQHTSSRESRALNVKLDELIRVTRARNELIGAEDESHDQLAERREELLDERAAGD